MFDFGRSKRIYLDYAAATPVRREVFSVMEPFFSDKFANPSAIHTEGQAARAAVEASRLSVARILGVRPEGIVWTASGTESNNLAIYGLIRALKEGSERDFSDIEIITTVIEHPSILEAVEHLKSHGVTVHYVSVNESGRIDTTELTSLLSKQTALVTFSYVNSEVGVIEDVKKITRLVRLFNKEHDVNILTHLDAAQAPLWLPCSLSQLGVDLLSLDAGKCCGPKGVGVLAFKHGISLKGIILGGGQESGLRSGTENTPLIVGAAKAFEIAQATHTERSEKVSTIRDYAFGKLSNIEGVHINGSQEERVANNVNISIDGVEAEFAAITLDVAGIACSTKSACGSGKGEGSSVVRTLTDSDERATTSLRFTFGEQTTKSEIDKLVTALRGHILKTRAFGETY